MKQMLFIGICLTVFLLLLASCARIFGGMSKTQATTIFNTYLSKRFKDKLATTHITRFFNEGNMNPNMFTVEIFEKERPDIRFAIHFDAKLMKEKDTLYQGGLQKKSIALLYKEEIANYEAKQQLITKFKEKSITLKITYNSVYITFHTSPTPIYIKEQAQVLIEQLNYYKNHLKLSGYLKLYVNTPDFKNDLFMASLQPNSEGWGLKWFQLNEKAKQFTHINDSCKQTVENYVAKNKTKYVLYPWHANFVNTNSFKEVIWLQFLANKTPEATSLTGNWQDTITGVLIVYIDINTLAINGIEIKSITSSLPYQELLETIQKELPFTQS